MELYKLDELTEGSAFEAEYDKAILEGLSHVDAVERASNIVEELTPKKVLGYALRVKNFEAEIVALELEAKKLSERARVKANKIEALKDRLTRFLPRDFELEDARAIVRFKKLPDVAKINDPSLLAPEFIRIKPASSTPAKDEITKALKAGEIVTGAVLEQNRYAISIK